jgi:hypothetical protein
MLREYFYLLKVFYSCLSLSGNELFQARIRREIIIGVFSRGILEKR